MPTKKNFHLILGLTFLFIGLYGVYDEIYNVVDFIKGIVQPITLAVGGFLLFLGMQRGEAGAIKNALLGAGTLILVVGFYGLYDEWYAFSDMMLGVLPLLCIAFGGLSLIAGINKLKA
ncbi:MAG: hypothetical protein HQK50_09705 [Oligoflexia bacterium]|nr:hypothetical protein [Oligoflexia bacterium]MBF0365837.1 hypothetical protein [Oligoflexia bacterium]